MNVTFVRSEQVAKSIRMFWFKPAQAIHYTAGQFIELKLPHENPDERGDKRWFTLTSSPSEELLAITTKFSVPSSSFKQTLSELRPGTALHMSDPMGDFVLPKDSSIPLVFIAGGIGITPVRSMIKWLSDTSEKRGVTVLYTTTNHHEFAFTELLKDYGMHLIQRSGDKDGDASHLSAKTILELTTPADNAQLYLSGPEPMIETLVAQFETLNYDEHSLITDYFPGYAPI